MAKGLGKGLSALLADIDHIQDEALEKIRIISIAKLQAGSYQPRRHFNEQALNELAQSIAQKGVLQPLLVRKLDADEEQYEIIAGERRWRAAQIAAIHEVPVIIKDFTLAECLEIGLIENLQREDLNPIEEAEGYVRLIKEFDYTQEQVAKLVAKSRPYITNLLRLNQLPQEVKQYVQQGDISAGHARALVNYDDAIALARQIIEKGLSVRQVEMIVRGGQPKTSSHKASEASKSADILAIENNLTMQLGVKVSLKEGRHSNSGTISLMYSNLDQLDFILKKLES